MLKWFQHTCNDDEAFAPLLAKHQRGQIIIMSETMDVSSSQGINTTVWITCYHSYRTAHRRNSPLGAKGSFGDVFPHSGGWEKKYKGWKWGEPTFPTLEPSGLSQNGYGRCALKFNNVNFVPLSINSPSLSFHISIVSGGKGQSPEEK